MRRLSLAVWLIVAWLHAIGAAIWWWMMPAGFPVVHARFWVHRVVPFVLVAFAIALVVPRLKTMRPALLAAVPATYLGGAIAGRVVFPATLRTLWFAPLVVGLVLLAMWIIEHRAQWKRALVIAVPAAALGCFLAIAQIAPPPSTHPRNVEAAGEPTSAFATVWFDASPLSVTIYPSLAFISRSPDRSWTVLASDADRLGPVDETFTRSSRVDEAGVLHVDAYTALPHAVYSHLNTYTAMAVDGHHRLFVAFSPAPDARIEVVASDYPAGRPMRFAYVDADRTFHVVQAANAEKGPYSDLATGRLGPDDALAITFYDEQKALARVTLDDFAAQVSTELSPTAGWGVPQNAIEFALSGDEPSSSASFFITLAGTGVGRGFESVGHGPGVYRNRLRAERLR